MTRAGEAAQLDRCSSDAVLLDALARQSELVDRLQELDRAKTEFVSSVSHELRTPLTGILGYVEMLAGGDAGAMEANQLRLVEIIDLCTRRLLTLIEDLLTVSRVESGTFTLEPGSMALQPLLKRVHEGILPFMAKRRLELSIAVETGTVTIWADGEQLERVLMNLLTNAVKFTPDGGRISLIAQSRANTVVLTVSDTGIGIPADEQPRLFERFFRSSLSRELAVPGTGLGLGIVQSIIDEHGGSIEIASAPGEGTKVQVTLPCPLPRSPNEPGTTEATGASRRLGLNMEEQR